jgi:hypothetical protein
MIAAVALHRAALRNSPKSAAEYLETVLVQDLPETVALKRQRQEKIWTLPSVTAGSRAQLPLAARVSRPWG